VTGVGIINAIGASNNDRQHTIATLNATTGHAALSAVATRLLTLQAYQYYERLRRRCFCNLRLALIMLHGVLAEAPAPAHTQ